MSVNKVILVGRLGQVPQISTTASQTKVANFSIATSEKWRDKNTGDLQERTEWHRITVFGRLADIVGNYITKGTMVYIEGSLHTRKYTDQQGIERYVTEVRVNNLHILAGGLRPDQSPNQATHMHINGGFGTPLTQSNSQQANFQPPTHAQTQNMAFTTPANNMRATSGDSDMPF